MNKDRYLTRTRHVLFAAAALLMFISLTAMTSQAQAASTADQKPVMLGGALDLSSYLAQYDQSVKAGIQLAIQAVNNNGGVLDNRPLKVTVYNMKADPATGVRVIQRLITAKHVTAILHGFSSASTRAVQPIVASHEVPLIAASVLPKNANFEFTTITPAKFIVSTRLEYLKNQGIDQVGVLHDGTPYNEIQLKILKKLAKSMGMKVVGVEQHANDAVSLRPQVTALLQAGAEAVVKLSAGPTTIVAAKAMSQADTNAPLLSAIDSLRTNKQAAKAYAHFAAVMSGPQAYPVLPSSMRTTSLTHFMQLYRKSDETKYDPTYMGRGWDAVHILARAINKAGSLKGSAIQKAIETMGPYQGASGEYNFSADMHYGIHQNPFLLVGFNPKGKMKVVYTPKSSGHE